MDLESELISLISQLLFLPDILKWKYYRFVIDLDSETLSVIRQVISMVRSMDFNSQPKPKPESEFMSFITQAISVFYSMDLDSQPKPLQKLISYFSQQISFTNSIHSDSNSNRKQLSTYIDEILILQPEPELVSLIYKIFSLVISMKSKSEKFISLCPQTQVRLESGKFQACKEVQRSIFGKWDCLPWNWVNFLGEDSTRFYCLGCKGNNHEEYKKVPVEIKHHLHRNHSLHLVFLKKLTAARRQCYCGDEDLDRVFYYCWACDFAINMACPILLYIDHPKWHEHTLHLFPRLFPKQASLTCNLCALDDASSHIYMCPNCAFVAHLRCIDLPRVIRISRHHHRISFTPFLDHGDSSCGVCRRNIDNYYGGYSCIKEGCRYAVHSRCATQKNVWDGKELEGELEEEEEDIEELKPFVRISDEIIEHFSHQHHHLKLDENTDRDYNENRQCQACITPIYFGNFYTCMQCDFILHEKCANLSRKIYHPVHPHLLTLGYVNVVDHYRIYCTACSRLCTSGFFYQCGKVECNFKLHVQCATISEPLVHESHIHPLFLTSKPGEERRICSVCKENYGKTNETFNCIECDFALCFGCATLPQKVRYKHDKHVLTLSYGKETSTMAYYWCEICERKGNPKKRFYMCDEYCCVTLHIKCLLGRDLYIKPGSSWFLFGIKVQVLPNNNHMTRPICSICKQRCSQKIFFQLSGSISCSIKCLRKLARRHCSGLD